jgi:type II secretory pathway pseudopilin PulG
MRRRNRDGQAGFSTIEVLVAMILVTIGLVGTLEAFISVDKANMKTQEAQALSTAAEQTLEQIRALSYSSLALSVLPTHSGDGNGTGDASSDPADPDYWISGAELLIPGNFEDEASGILTGVAGTGEALISGGSVNPGPVTVTSDGFTVSVYRYVSWVDDSCVLGILGNLCPGSEDAKRVTVAAVLDGSQAQSQKPFWLSTIIANPDAGVGL